MTEHDDVIRLLREGRPQATEMELDQIKQQVRRRAAAPSGRKPPVKSRVAILGMLVAGALFSTAGVGLAVSGSNPAQTNASVAQYATPTPTPTPTTTVTPACVPNSGTMPGSGQTGCTPPCTDTTSGGGTSPASGSPTAECSPTPEGGVLPAEAGSGGKKPASGNAPATGSGGVAPATATNTQPTRQEAAATNSTLPFTGFAAIPVILGGLALLSGGLILRRRTKPE
jgi:hypothetical protein